MRPQPMIAVSDVAASSRWYQELLGCTSGHGGPEYEQLLFDGQLVLQLHDWEEDHHHGAMGDPDVKPYGNGALLWFETDEFDAAAARAEAMGANTVHAAHINPNAKHREIWLRDPDGYLVVLASPYGDAA